MRLQRVSPELSMAIFATHEGVGDERRPRGARQPDGRARANFGLPEPQRLLYNIFHVLKSRRA